MKKSLAVLAVLAMLPMISEACGGVAARHAARVSARHTVVSRSYAVPFVAVPQTPAPKVMASPTDLEGRVARLEKNTADAGRALLFGTSPPAAAAPMKSVPVYGTVYSVRAREPRRVIRSRSVTRSGGITPVASTMRALAAPLSGCPGGRCPAR